MANEGYLQLLRLDQWDWRDYGEFIAVIHHALRRQVVHRSGREGTALRFEARSVDLPTLHRALLRFREIDPEALAVIELKYFGGLTMEEIAACTGRPRRDVERDHKVGRAWLNAELAQ